MALRAHAFIATIAHTSSPAPPSTTTCVRSRLNLQQGRRMMSRQPSLAAKSPKHGSHIQTVVRGSLGGETGVPPETSEAAEYVEASIMEAAEVRTGPDGFRLTMNDGTQLPCHYIHPTDLRAAPTGPHAALVLKLNDGSGIMLPIIVVEYPRAMAMDAVQNIPMIRPTVYQVMKQMVTFLGYKVQMVRVTHRENDSYCARLYLEKGASGGEGEEVISLDMRPSDAINLAIRAKAPIEVKRALALMDGVVAAMPALPIPLPYAVAHLGPGADKPSEDPCLTSEEFGMVRSIAIAALLERYGEAAQLKDELAMFRASLGISVGEEGWGESGSGSLQQQDQTDFWTERFPDWFSFVDQCSTMAQAISEKIKNVGKEEAIADARKRFTILLEKS